MAEVAGLPLHPLVVHAVVVLVPLVAAGMVLAAASRTWADRLRLVLAVLAPVAAVAAVVARWSGQALLVRTPGSAEAARHADQSDALHWLVIAVAALVLAWAWTGRTGSSGRWLGALAAVASVVATAWTVVAGHSGAISVWGDF